jgi:hypothetical protein
MGSQRLRRLAILTAVAFAISTAFPVVAGFTYHPESFPKWWGIVDVALAFCLGVLAMWILGATQGAIDKQAEEASYRAYRFLAHGILAVLVIFFLAGDRIVWSQCLSGLAWRLWLLLYTLPAWLRAVRPGAI